jgi:hypothetical protein
MGSVVMHNLRRVAAGLRGEYLEPEKTPEPEEDENADGFGTGKKFNKNRKGFTTLREEDWEDKAVYEQEQGGIEVGEIGDRMNFVQEGGEEPEVQVTAGAEDTGAKKRKKEGEAKSGDAVVDKEARKKAKKERDLERHSRHLEHSLRHAKLEEDSFTVILCLTATRIPTNCDF